MRPLRQPILAYVLAGVLSIGGGLFLSTKFIGLSRAQEDEIEMPPPPPTLPALPSVEPTPPASSSQPNSSAPSVSDSAPAPPPAAVPISPAPPATAQPEVAPPETAQQGTAPPATVQQGTGALSELEGFMEPFIYDINNRRDPFIPYSEYVAPDVEGGPARANTPAQRYNLDDLKLVGVMWDIRNPKAMFMAPESQVLVLGRDESIGNRQGYIASIREGEVVVVEATRKRGELVYKTRVLRIER